MKHIIITLIILTFLSCATKTVTTQKVKFKLLEEPIMSEGFVESVNQNATKYQCTNNEDIKNPKYLIGFFIDAGYYTKCYKYYQGYKMLKEELELIKDNEIVIDVKYDYTNTFIIISSALASFIIGGLTVHSMNK